MIEKDVPKLCKRNQNGGPKWYQCPTETAKMEVHNVVEKYMKKNEKIPDATTKSRSQPPGSLIRATPPTPPTQMPTHPANDYVYVMFLIVFMFES